MAYNGGMKPLPDHVQETTLGRPRERGHWLLVSVAALVSLEPAVAQAYIDPGTGSMLLQSLLAAIAAGLVFGRTIWFRIKSFFRREKGSSSDTEN